MQHSILVFNCGSSSLKFAVIEPKSQIVRLSGLAECLNTPNSRIKWQFGENKTEQKLNNASHQVAIQFLIDNILATEPALLNSIGAIGHRIAHGGEKYTQSTLINSEVLMGIRAVSHFAPLHNPANIAGIEAAMISFPHLKNKNVAVFDTAFHTTLPDYAYLYALPIEFYEKYGIRRYGFHGISHYYVTQQAAKRLEKPADSVNLITCHLGNGCSISAIKNGRSIDTSMGFTPGEGLVMGTRAGDLDAGIVLFLQQTLGLSIDDVSDLLNKQSGVKGINQVTNDFRYITAHLDDRRMRLALDLFIHRLVKYIGGYCTLLDNRLDALVFTGGIGENCAPVRYLVLEKLAILGFQIDTHQNLAMICGQSGKITSENSHRCAFVIPTNEELVIAQQTEMIRR